MNHKYITTTEIVEREKEYLKRPEIIKASKEIQKHYIELTIELIESAFEILKNKEADGPSS